MPTSGWGRDRAREPEARVPGRSPPDGHVNKSDDLIGDCHIVLIQAVAAFNPWLGIRFSTYAYTCLVRALARMAQRMANDWLSRSAPLDLLPEGEPRQKFDAEFPASGLWGIEEYLRADHPLLSQREKVIISRAVGVREGADMLTLRASWPGTWSVQGAGAADAGFRPRQVAVCPARRADPGHLSRRPAIVDSARPTGRAFSLTPCRRRVQ